MCISVGNRDGGPDIGALRTHLIWARNAQELSIVDLRWGVILFLIPVCMYNVPGIFFVIMV